MADTARVLWITGLSGAGKSTIAKEIIKSLKAHSVSAVMLDGDVIRDAINDSNIGHDHQSRLINAYRISRFSKCIAKQGVIVIVATMSLFHEIHEWNRKNILRYFEVYLKVDIEVLKRRDPKGLYSRAENNKERNVGGIDLDFEEPVEPDMTIVNNETMSDFSLIALDIINQANLLEPYWIKNKKT
jgi:adenylylsulfate kinase